MALTPPPTPDPLPGKLAEATDFRPMGTAPRITKLLMKNTLLRSNSTAWWMMLSLGSTLVSDLSCTENFSFRSSGRGRRCVSQRSRRTLCSQTPKQYFFYACVVHQLREIDTVPTVPRIHLRPRKVWAQHAQSTRAPFLDWNAYATLSTFSANDHSKWVMNTMTTYITPNSYPWAQREKPRALL